MSWKHLRAPFENKTHLVTIILVGAAFVTWRMSGGDLGTNSNNSSAIESSDSNTLGPLNNLDQVETAADLKRNRVREQLRTKVLGNLVTPKPTDEQEGAAEESLGDIEKLIGLK